MTESPGQPRPYGGRSRQERVEGRRTALIGALFELLVDSELHDVSIRNVCAEAGLTRRYFSESFEDLDALVLAAFRSINDDVLRETVETLGSAPDDPVAAAELLLTSTVSVATSHPGKARLIIAAAGIRALADERSATIRAISAHLGDYSGSAERGTVSTIVIVGGITELVAQWLGGQLDVTRDEIVAEVGGIVRRLMGGPADGDQRQPGSGPT